MPFGIQVTLMVQLRPSAAYKWYTAAAFQNQQ